MTVPVSPTVSGGDYQSEEQPGSHTDGSSGISDAPRMRLRAQTIRIACDIAAVAQRYQKIHHALFGFSVRRILQALQPKKHEDFETLAVKLDSIQRASKQIQLAFDNADFVDLPKHAKSLIAVRDALKGYTEAVSNVALTLKIICQNLHREGKGETGFVDYSASQFRRDKTVYDASLQEFRRWGARLTELFEKF